MKVDGLDRAQPDCGSEYEAEQPHAAERCSEEIRILGTAGDDDIPIRKQNGHGIDAVAEAALRVMRLAVYVVGDVAGDCNELRSWRNHRKPASRGKGLDNALQAGARLTGEHSGQLVKGKQPVHSRRFDHLPAAVNRAVPVASVESSRKVAPGSRRVATSERNCGLAKTH